MFGAFQNGENPFLTHSFSLVYNELVFDRIFAHVKNGFVTKKIRVAGDNRGLHLILHSPKTYS